VKRNIAIKWRVYAKERKQRRHQEDGLRFILQREDEGFWQQLLSQLRQGVASLYAKVILLFYNGSIGSLLASTKEVTSISFGGLIADVMGLGKTLTMLTAILHSAALAESFGNFYEMRENESVEAKVRTKATLVIVSSARKSERPYG